jgi:hypothetical protein
VDRENRYRVILTRHSYDGSVGPSARDGAYVIITADITKSKDKSVKLSLSTSTGNYTFRCIYIQKHYSIARHKSNYSNTCAK